MLALSSRSRRPDPAWSGPARALHLSFDPTCASQPTGPSSFPTHKLPVHSRRLFSSTTLTPPDRLLVPQLLSPRPHFFNTSTTQLRATPPPHHSKSPQQNHQHGQGRSSWCRRWHRTGENLESQQNRALTNTTSHCPSSSSPARSSTSSPSTMWSTPWASLPTSHTSPPPR